MAPSSHVPVGRRRSLRLFIGLGALVCLTALWLLSRNRARSEESAPERPAGSRALVQKSSAPASPVVEVSDAAALETPEPAALAPTPNRLERALEDFKRQAVYPPESRPFDAGSRYKLDWNASLVDDIPFETFEDGGIDGDVYYRLLADRAHCGPGEALTTTLQVYRGTPEARLPIQVHAAGIVSVRGAPTMLASIELRDDGVAPDARAGDLVYTHRFVPSEVPALIQAEAEGLREVALDFDVEAGGKRLRMRRAFTYTAVEPLELVGIRDVLAAGSLSVTLAFQVRTPGLYTFEGNLLSGDGTTPIGWVHQSQALRSGRDEVELVFFGKILKDTQLDGPYLLSGLRGFLRSPQGAPLRWWVARNTHRTQFYPAAEFSGEEWSSPEKEARIQMLQSLIDDASGGTAGAATGEGVAQPTTSPHIHIDERGEAHPAPSP